MENLFNNRVVLFMVALSQFVFRSSYASTNSNMFGIVTKDTVFLTTMSTFHGPSGVMMQSGMDWITSLAGGKTLVGLRGDPSDCDYLRGQLQTVCNEHILNFNGRPLSCSAISNYCRLVIAKHMRSNPLTVEVLIAGWDENKKQPVLYWLDEVGAMQAVPYAAHGREFPFIFSVLDRTETTSEGICKKLKDFNEDDGLNVIQSCWKVINKRTSGCESTDQGIIRIYGVSEKGITNYQ